MVIWSGEDDPSDTLIPRLAASGADLERVFFVADVVDGQGKRPFDPARDIESLQTSINAAGGAALIIVDPIVSAVGADSHKNAETRRSLQPLVDLAASVDAALLGIAHFSKGTAGREPIERVNGSIAFGAMARVVMVAAKEPAAEDGTAGRRILARAKSNIGPDEGGFAYSLALQPMPGHPDIDASIMTWGDRIEGTAGDMLAAAEAEEDQGEASALDDAKALLIEVLAEGPVSSKQVKADASGSGIAWRTVRRAQVELRIKPRKVGGEWVWSLPQVVQDETEGGQNTNPGQHGFSEKTQNLTPQGGQGGQGGQERQVEGSGNVGIIPNDDKQDTPLQNLGQVGQVGHNEAN